MKTYFKSSIKLIVYIFIDISHFFYKILAYLASQTWNLKNKGGQKEAKLNDMKARNTCDHYKKWWIHTMTAE